MARRLVALPSSALDDSRARTANQKAAEWARWWGRRNRRTEFSTSRGHCEIDVDEPPSMWIADASGV